jgi:hypothetical protein|uniref:Macroglobulin domain-containing protein n=1 Tax=Desulfobacca acetoxidans TaxID=60893 RepID=A0A7C3WQL2_9BACT
MSRFPTNWLRLWSLLTFWGVVAACRMPVPTPIGEVVWTRYQQEKKLTREEAIARHNYCPTSGCIIRLEDVQVRPTIARPGDTLVLTTTYTVLTAEDTPIPISITREIFHQGKSLGQTKAVVTRTLNGTWTQTMDFPLARDAIPGIYTLVTRIDSGYGRDEKSVQFAVR